MTTGPSAERRLRAYLDEGPTVLRAHLQDGIASQIRQTPQRGRPPWRDITMSSRVLVLWPAAVLVLIVGIAIGGSPRPSASRERPRTPATPTGARRA